MKEKLEENIHEPKALWKTLKTLGLPSKKLCMSKICLKEKDRISFDSKEISEIFKDYFSGLAENLVAKLPKAPKIYDTTSSKLYYSKLNVNQDSFSFTNCSNDQNLNITKAAGIDNLNSRFLKDGANILSIPLKQICNLSLRLSIFPKECKITKLNPLLKKGDRKSVV